MIRQSAPLIPPSEDRAWHEGNCYNQLTELDKADQVLQRLARVLGLNHSGRQQHASRT
jgi:hypothetical protein